MKKVGFLLLAAVLLFLAGCQVLEEDEGDVRILVWHGWTEDDALVLQAALDEFAQIYPHVTVVDLYVPETDILDQFVQKGVQGIGPDLIIGDANWIPELAESGVIAAYEPDGSVIMSKLAQEAVTYKDQIYGLPWFVEPYALYYNSSLVSRPASTLDNLVEESAAGRVAAFIPRFKEAYWGIEAFGSNLFDEEGNLDLSNSGFVPWLRWLSVAQNETSLIMNVDDERLEELFVAGEIAYYVAEPWKINRLQEAMGDDLAVTTLPAGPDGVAGPLLDPESILFFRYSSAKQAEMARTLGQFLVNAQQSIGFMREINKVPANPRVGVDARLYPVVSGFSRQARSASTLPTGWDVDSLVTAGDRAYAAVLSGELTAEEAACAFAKSMVGTALAAGKTVIVPEDCDLGTTE